MKVLILSKTNIVGVTSVLLENQEKFLREGEKRSSSGYQPDGIPNQLGNMLGSLVVSVVHHLLGPTAGFDPVLISLIRRSMPNLVMHMTCAVRSTNERTNWTHLRNEISLRDQSGTETFYNEVDRILWSG